MIAKLVGYDTRRRAVDFLNSPAAMAAAPDTETAVGIIRELLDALNSPIVSIRTMGRLSVDEVEGGYCVNNFSIDGLSLDNIIGPALGAKRSDKGSYDYGKRDGALGMCCLFLDIIPEKQDQPTDRGC